MPGGSTRDDTIGTCNGDDNRFAFGWNSGPLTAGPQPAKSYKEGVLCQTPTVTVMNLGSEFLTGATGQSTLEDFPGANDAVELERIEAMQNFSIVGADQAETINPGDPIRTTQIGTFDQNGQRATFIINSPCAANRLNIAVESCYGPQHSPG